MLFKLSLYLFIILLFFSTLFTNNWYMKLLCLCLLSFSFSQNLIFMPFIFFIMLAGFLFLILFGNKIGRLYSAIVGIMCNYLSLIIVLEKLYLVIKSADEIELVIIGSWFKSDCLSVDWGFLFDPLSLVMCFVILSISLFVQIYSYAYMFFDPSLPRFMAYLCFFIFFMLILVTANNLVVLFLGWEGVGLCSYLLISFWNTRLTALKSALKAMLINRIGDFFLLVAIIFIFTEFGSLNFLSLFTRIPYYTDATFILFGINFNFLNFVCIFLLLGAFGKSAQLGLHVWLPDAMEGPTPVSALIHAATMVTAGIFLVIRCSPIFEYSQFSLFFLVFIGSFTAVFAGTCGMVESDIKKIIAYSTCSQLGYMFFICGLSGYNLGLFHLFNHAFFKALLFLSAGSVIHCLSNEQNITRMGSLKNILPVTYAATLIGLLSLNAFPFTSGFYSKEIILSGAFISSGFISFFAYFLGVFTSFLTAFYSYRLFYYVFLSENNSNKQVILNIHSENFIIVIPLLFLSFMSIFSGYLFKDLFLGLGSNFFDYSIFILPENSIIPKAEFLPSYIKLIPLFFSFTGWGVLNPYIFDIFIKFKLPNLYNFLKNEWFFNTFFNNKLNTFFSFSFQNIFLIIDNGLLQFFGPLGIFNSFFNLSFLVSKYHSGYVHNYLCTIVLGVLFFYLFVSNFIICNL